MGWERTEATEENVAYVFTAQWEVDEVGKTDADGTDMPDGIPDKYQKKVVFEVVNGYWQEGTDADKVLWLTLVDENGNWAEDGSAVLEIPTGMYAKRGYENGKWDTTPPETVSGTDSETFTYRFNRIPVNENVPDTGDASAKTVLICVTAMTVSAAALMLMLVAYYRDKKRRTR
jgi:hypothetical protein